ncbi:MAG: ABC transporter substrate-binding protein [Candidatus Schmidhempelia sp.]|nr:ABC transporter substrate-binding protein [Candidatus Schmidhempelia sp.]
MKTLDYFRSIAIGLLITLSYHSTLEAQERLVTAGGSITEIIAALGAQHQLVGVDMSSTYPESIKHLPQIGYWKQLNIEGILSLKPTLLITWQDAEPNLIFQQLTQANVKVLRLQRIPMSLALLKQNIQLIGNALNQQWAANQLINQIDQQLAKTQLHIQSFSTKPNVLFLFNFSGAIQVAGKNTVADSVITLAGGNNIAVHDNYKNYSTEAFITANPEVMIITSQALNTIGGIENLAQFTAITHTSAWKNKRIVVIDQALILGMGPRIGEAVTTLTQGFYPLITQ